MSTVTLATRADGQIIYDSWFNDLRAALGTDFVGRNASGQATAGQNLGTATYPWGTANITKLILDGSEFDPGSSVYPANRLISGETRALSSRAHFMRPAGTGGGLSGTIRGTTTALSVDVNGTTVSVSTNLTATGLTAAPASNNTASVSGTQDEAWTKYLGEERTVINMTSVGTEISSREGQVCAFKTNSNEILLAYIETTSRLSIARRGCMVDSSGAPIDRHILTGAVSLTLLGTNWVFLGANGSSVYTTDRTPIVSAAEPAAPEEGDHWYDLTADEWKVYDTGAYVSGSRVLLGVFATDTSDCIGARCFDYYTNWDEINTIHLVRESAGVVIASSINTTISVNGNLIRYQAQPVEWEMAIDLVETEEVSIMYYFYITEDGALKISSVRPYHRPDLRGDYHPHEMWRCVGSLYNNADGDLEYAADELDVFERAFTVGDEEACRSGKADFESVNTALLWKQISKGIVINVLPGNYTEDIELPGSVKLTGGGFDTLITGTLSVIGSGNHVSSVFLYDGSDPCLTVSGTAHFIQAWIGGTNPGFTDESVDSVLDLISYQEE